MPAGPLWQYFFRIEKTGSFWAAFAGQHHGLLAPCTALKRQSSYNVLSLENRITFTFFDDSETEIE